MANKTKTKTKTNFKTILVIVFSFIMVSIFAPIIVVIFDTHYGDWINDESPHPPQSVPIPPLTVKLWLDLPGKTHFSTSDKVTLFYQFNAADGHLLTDYFYFSLLNVSSDDKWNIILDNKMIKADKLYSLPRGEHSFQPGQNVSMDARLRLKAGHQDFKAIVTDVPITWRTVIDIDKRLQRLTFWGMGTLTVDVE